LVRIKSSAGLKLLGRK